MLHKYGRANLLKPSLGDCRGTISLNLAERREGTMAVKILIKRKFKDGNLKMAARLLINNRNGAMQQPGYISSETMQRLEDPFQITVVSMWKDIEAWETWKNSETRLANENEAKDYLVGQAEYEHYSLGLPLE
jgi:heme-degrading monooxygenase HmoA